MTEANLYNSNGILKLSRNFKYDPLDRRIGVSSEGETHGNIFDRRNPLIRVNVEGEVEEYRMYDHYLDGIYAIDTKSNVHWTMRDHVGSIRGTLANDLQLLSQIHYDSFGRVLSETGVDTNYELRFSSRPIDNDFSFIDLRARSYSNSLGRFFQEDPLWPKRFEYAENNPLVYKDLTGENALIIAAVIFVAIVVAILWPETPNHVAPPSTNITPISCNSKRTFQKLSESMGANPQDDAVVRTICNANGG
jgi:RHS repeat-associated protein